MATDDFLCKTENKLGQYGVIEANLKLTGNAGKYGVIFGWIDEHNYYKVVFLSKSKEVQLLKINYDEENLIVQSILPEDFDEKALHCIRVACDRKTLVIYIDNRKQMWAAIQSIEGSIGYFATAGGIAIGFTGFCNGTAPEAEMELYKPIPGEFPACTAIANSAVEYPEGTISICDGQQLLYHVNIETSGKYVVDLFCRFSEQTSWQISVDGICVTDKSFPMKESGFISICTELPEGFHTLGLLLQKGHAELDRLGIYKAVEVMHGNKKTVNEFGPYGKLLWGEDGWSNYKVQANIKVTPESETGQAGVLLRTSEPSEGGEGKDPILGTNFFKGYFIGLSNTHITLSKHAYDERILCKKELAFDIGETHLITVEVIDDTFNVYIDNSSNPIFVYHDKIPFTHGRVGVRSQNAYLEGSVVISSI